MTDSPSDPSRPAPEVNTSVPQTARIWNYWLGGEDGVLPPELDAFGGVGRKP